MCFPSGHRQADMGGRNPKSPGPLGKVVPAVPGSSRNCKIQGVSSVLATVVVWKLDRLSRSLKDVLHIMERIAEAGAGFRSITENIDTTTPAGRMMMQMVGSFAEFERAMIRERTSAGIAVARAEGRIGGRRKKLDATKRREIAESVISGRKSGADMARLYNVSQPTVSRIVSQHRERT